MNTPGLAGVLAAVLLLPIASPDAAAASGTVLPVVSGESASTAPLVGGKRISLHGSGFGHVTKVLFGGAEGHSVRVASAQALTVVVPRHKAGRVDVRVVTAAGESKAVKVDRFTYVAPPTVTKVTPTSGAGARVTVKGKNFLHVKGVLFGTAKGSKLHVLSSTTLLVIAPAHSPGVVDLRVTTAYGSSKTVKADHFTYAATTLPGPPVTTTPTPAPVPTTPVRPLVITTTALADEYSGYNYSTTALTATGGTGPYTWSATGLPNGLDVSADGTLSGHSYAVAGLRQVTLQVSDSRNVKASARLPLNVLATPGQVYAWGYDAFGNIGDGSINPPGGMLDTSKPIEVAGLDTVVQVAATESDGFALKADGTVWAWGGNAKGLIGDDTTTPSLTPKKVAGLPRITQIAVTGSVVLALAADGTAYSWGPGAGGQLGDGSQEDALHPVQISGVTDAVSIGGSAMAGYAVRKDGTVLAWGNGMYNLLGNGVTGVQSTPAQIPGLTDVVSVSGGGLDAFALHGDGTVSGWGIDNGDPGEGLTGVQPAPVLVPGLTDITQLAFGSGPAFALRSDGTILAWGYDEGGNLGDGTRNNSASPVTVLNVPGAQAVWSINDTAFAQLADGTVRAWGSNTEGQIGDDTAVGHITPIAATWLPRTAGMADGVVSLTAFQIRRPITLPVHPFPAAPPPS